MNLRGIHRPYKPKHYRIHILFSRQGTFSKTDHIVSRENRLRYKKIKTTLCTLANHNGIELDINSKRNYSFFTVMEIKQYTIE